MSMHREPVDKPGQQKETAGPSSNSGSEQHGIWYNQKLAIRIIYPIIQRPMIPNIDLVKSMYNYH